MRKIFTLAAALLASFTMMAETVTFSAADIAAGTVKSGITPYFGKPTVNKNICKDGDTQTKADVCEVKNSSDTILVNSLKEQAQVLFTANEKYITKVIVKGSTNGSGTSGVKNIPALYWKGTTRTDNFDGAELVSFSGYDAACESSYYTFEKMPAKTQLVGIFRRVKVDDAANPTKKLNKSGVNYGDGQTFYVEQVEVYYDNACTAPATPLTLKIDQTTTIYEGDVFNLSTEGGNGITEIALKLDGADYANWYWTAVAGEHTFTAYQDKNGDVCAQEAELKLDVKTKTPVTSVVVSGPTAGYVGMPMTFTVTADNATDYRWLVNGSSVPGETGTSFTYTPTATTSSATELSIRCDAWNEFNGYSSGSYKAWKSSDLHFIEVSVLSGAIMEYKVETGSGNIDKDITAGGIIGATGHQKTQSNGKLGGEGHHLYFQLNGLKFQEEDTVVIYVKPESDKVPATLVLSSDLAATDTIGFAQNLTKDNTNPVKIVLTKGADALYLARTSTNKQNPILDSIAVIRSVDDGSPVLKVSTTSVNVKVTAESPKATAKFSYSGKHLTPGTYDLSFSGGTPGGSWWDCTPKSVIVGADGKLNAEIAVTFDGEGGSGSSIPLELSITFGLAINSISVSTIVICDFDMEKDYIAKSVNIEQLILDNGKNYDIVTELMSAEINYQKIDALDSLSDKTGRNEPYLGLKLKADAEAMIGGWVKKNDVLRVKFGNIPDAVLVTINDAAPVESTVAEYEFTAIEDSYIKFSPKGTGSKLVIKQIMLNEPIAAVTLPDVPTAIDNTEAENNVVKAFENGQLVIIKNGTKYNAQGAIVK